MISFVFPAYNEEESLDKLIQEMLRVKSFIEDYVELVFVNDGSRDQTLNKLKVYAIQYPFIKIINFSRNFGHQIALTAGLDYAQGDAVIIMDSDLQDPPDVALQLIEKWREGFDVVYAKRRTRRDGFMKKITAWGFYRLLRAVANVDIPKDTGDFRLLDKKVVQAMRTFRESNRYLRGLTSYVGFNQTFVLFDRQDRIAGVTKYPWKKMIHFAWDGITSFSTAPLRISSYIGLLVAFLSFLGILYAIVMKLFFPEITVPGWTLMIIAICFIGGVQLLMLGIIGEYIGRIYTEVQERPLYLVKELINLNTDQSGGRSTITHSR